MGVIAYGVTDALVSEHFTFYGFVLEVSRTAARAPPDSDRFRSVPSFQLISLAADAKRSSMMFS